MFILTFDKKKVIKRKLTTNLPVYRMNKHTHLCRHYLERMELEYFSNAHLTLPSYIYNRIKPTVENESQMSHPYGYFNDFASPDRKSMTFMSLLSADTMYL